MRWRGGAAAMAAGLLWVGAARAETSVHGGERAALGWVAPPVGLALDAAPMTPMVPMVTAPPPGPVTTRTRSPSMMYAGIGLTGLGAAMLVTSVVWFATLPCMQTETSRFGTFCDSRAPTVAIGLLLGTGAAIGVGVPLWSIGGRTVRLDAHGEEIPPPNVETQHRSSTAMSAGITLMAAGFLTSLGGAALVLSGLVSGSDCGDASCGGGDAKFVAGIVVGSVGVAAIAVGIPLTVWGAHRVPLGSASTSAAPTGIASVDVHVTGRGATLDVAF